MIKISVLIVTYNQEDVIRRTLDSVLVQKEFGLHKIVVCDDCSKDSTWSILEEYTEKYPEYMDIHENEHNLGIYSNMERVVELRPKSDLFYKLSGDDALCPYFFEKIQKEVEKREIDTNEAVGLYFDWKSVLPNGKEYVFRQNMVERVPNAFGLYLRGKASIRSLVVSDRVLANYRPVIKDKGLNLSEAMFDSQDHLLIGKRYYVPYIATIYYAEIGVSKGLSNLKCDYKTIQTIEKCEFLREHIATDPLDKRWLDYMIERIKYSMAPSIKGLYKTMRLYLSCKNSYYGISLRERLITYRSFIRIFMQK